MQYEAFGGNPLSTAIEIIFNHGDKIFCPIDVFFAFHIAATMPAWNLFKIMDG